MEEIFKDIVKYEGLYKISNYGKVKSLQKKRGFFKQKEKILTQGILRNGYPYITLSKNNKAKSFTVHRLVAKHFIPNNNDELQINHIDGIKKNNYFRNLEWVTGSENIIHAYKIGKLCQKHEKNNQAKLTKKEVLWIRKNKNKLYYKDMAKKLNVSKALIGMVVNNKIWIF